MAARSGMSDLITRMRPLINDEWQLHQDTQTGDGSNKLFWTNFKPNKSGGTVAVGGTVQGTAAYTWDTTFGRVEITTAPANLATITVEYQASELRMMNLRMRLTPTSPFCWTNQLHGCRTPTRAGLSSMSD